MNKFPWMNSIYYHLKPIIPRRLQIWMRSKMLLLKYPAFSDVWPILEKAGEPPEKWGGWPGGKKFALVLTHDVDTAIGLRRCWELARMEKKLGFRSSFNFVPERYNVLPILRYYLVRNGFEVGVHGLNHDGKLYKSRNIFQARSARINEYLKAWGAVGFRSPAMHHNLDWIHDLNIEYDASTFDTDPFEPQSDGAGTIFPFLVKCNSPQNKYVELPYTLPQDFTLFVLMKESTIDLWKTKMDWIVEKGGMVLLNTHPDYMNFEERKCRIDEYPVRYYSEILQYIKYQYAGDYWHVLPKETAEFWKVISSDKGITNETTHF